MHVLRSDDLAQAVSSIIHEGTQLHDYCLDLTIGKVRRLTGPGSLDFGGSEFTAASSKLVEPVKENKEDDYGWWQLEAGTYRATCNEELQQQEKGDRLFLVTAHVHASKAGLIIDSQLIDPDEGQGSPEITLRVPSFACNIKENARFAVLHILAG